MAVHRNPTCAELKALLESVSNLRVLRSPNTRDYYVWPAREALHADIAKALDLPFQTRDQLLENSFWLDRGEFGLHPDAHDIADVIERMK
jgi:hypothetical protein